MVLHFVSIIILCSSQYYYLYANQNGTQPDNWWHKGLTKWYFPWRAPTTLTSRWQNNNILQQIATCSLSRHPLQTFFATYALAYLLFVMQLNIISNCWYRNLWMLLSYLPSTIYYLLSTWHLQRWWVLCLLKPTILLVVV